MEDEIFHVTGHEEQNGKQRYSSNQALNGSVCVCVCVFVCSQRHALAALPLEKSGGIHCTAGELTKAAKWF